MTDTGQVPVEGQPENAGGQPEQPVAPAPGTYTFAGPAGGVTAGDEDDLLLPGAQGAWSEAAASAQPAPAPGPHETAPAGYDAVPAPHPAPSAQYGPQPAAPAGPQSVPPAGSTPDAQAAHLQAPQATQAPRRPLHLGPPVPEQSGTVRTLADRGPAPAPSAGPTIPVGPMPTPAHPMPVRQPGPPTGGPEYFDVAHEEPAAPAPEQDPAVLPGPQLGTFPQEPVGAGAWGPQAPVQEPAQAPVQEPAQAPGEVAGQPAGPPPSGPDLAAVPGPETPHQEPVPAQEQVSQEQPPAQEQVQEPVGEQAPAVPETEPQPQAPEAPAAPAALEAPAAPVAETPAAGVPVAEPSAPVAPEPQAAGQAPGPDASGAPEGGTPVSDVPEAPEASAAPAAVPEEDAGAPAESVPVPAPRQAPAEAPAEPAAEPVAAAPADGTPTDGTPVDTADTPADTADTSADAEGTPAPGTAGPADAGEQPAATAGRQLAVAAMPGAGPQVMEAVPATPADGAAPAQATAEAPAPAESAPQAEGEQPADGEQATDGEQAAPAEEAPAEKAPEAPDRGPAPAYGEAEREALHRVMRERRDIRNGFRPDPIPDEVLLRVLEAAHTAPSVGHSQPWDFVIIRSEETRRTMHELAMRQREAYARSLPRARAKQFKELKVEAILDTPVNIVVTADPTRGGRHTLGRHTQPQMAPYSSALAVENLWLAARAEGLGVGWVSFFDERELVRVLGLPEHLEVVAYLCIGYVDAFPDEPELVQAGWSKRRPLSWVVHEESYGRRVLPGAEEPHDLLTETLGGIRPLDAKALGEAWERQKRMTKPSGALGMLEIISAQLSGLARQCPPPVPEPAAVAVFAGDHGVHAQGVTAWPQEVTAQMVANFLAGGAVCNAFANQVGAEVCVVDVGVAGDLPNMPGLLPRKVRPGTADFTTGPALTREEVVRAVEVGIETARDLVAAGNKALLTGEMGIANTTVSAALISVFTGADPAEVTGRGTGVNDEMHAHKIDVVRRALELHQPDASDPLGVLAAVGGLEHAALAGLILGGASLRTPVILDGVSAGAAALVARAIAPEALAACIAGHRSAEPGHVAALTKLGLRPLIDLDLRLGEGTGALLALPVVQSAARAMHEVATFDSAGVTEKS